MYGDKMPVETGDHLCMEERCGGGLLSYKVEGRKVAVAEGSDKMMMRTLANSESEGRKGRIPKDGDEWTRDLVSCLTVSEF
jgi:hypothetical protein